MFVRSLTTGPSNVGVMGVMDGWVLPLQDPVHRSLQALLGPAALQFQSVSEEDIRVRFLMTIRLNAGERTLTGRWELEAFHKVLVLQSQFLHSVQTGLQHRLHRAVNTHAPSLMTEMHHAGGTMTTGNWA